VSQSLARLFDPASIAVVGASVDPTRSAARLLIDPNSGPAPIIDAPRVGASWSRRASEIRHGFGTARGTYSAPLATGRLTNGSGRSVGLTLVDGVRWRANELRPRETRLSQDPSPLRESGLAEERHAERVIA
jgi:hypothetical protein